MSDVLGFIIIAHGKTYSYGHLPVISGYKWDYTFYKWGYKYLSVQILYSSYFWHTQLWISAT